MHVGAHVWIVENMGRRVDVSQFLVPRQNLISRLIPDISRLTRVLVDYPLTLSRLI